MSRPKPLRSPVPLSNIENHLSDQISFIEAAGRAFDDGRTAEYRRIALAIRIMAYDRGQSRSLLTQLGMKGIPFLSYSERVDPRNLITSHPLAMIRMGPSGTHFIPMLDNGRSDARSLTFDDWWDEQVFRSPDGTTFTRGDFVSIVANQDGGAHVDPEIDERYSRLVNENLAGWLTGRPEGDTPILHIEKVYLRHIGFEFLNSVADAWQRRLGNRICECGSGRKHRYCCGKSPRVEY